MTGLAGKSATVPASGRGIGHAIALEPASERASVVVSDLDRDPTGAGCLFCKPESDSIDGRRVVCDAGRV